jgi:hypothetical protein
MTTPQPFPVNASYLTVIRGLLRMHWLNANGQFESPEADALRDAMDEPWERLSSIERKRIAGLSADLNAMSDTPTPHAPLEINPQAEENLFKVHEARQSGEWDQAQELLRELGGDVSSALLSYLRGTIWSAAGDAETVAVFFEHALHLEPENNGYQAELSHALQRVDQT